MSSRVVFGTAPRLLMVMVPLGLIKYIYLAESQKKFCLALVKLNIMHYYIVI